MPGIFGCLAIAADRRIPSETMDRFYAAMSGRLRHRGDYAEDHRIDPAGRWMVARIGNGRLMGPGIAYFGDSGRASVQYYGTLHGIATGAERRVPAGSSPLLAVAAENGYFSGFAVEESTGSLAVVVDRRASEPVFYLESDGIICFAPEVKALLDLGLPTGDLDPQALACFLSSGYLLPHQSLFSGIRKLRSGHTLVIADGNCRETEYWSYEPGAEAESGRGDALAEELAALVKESVRADFGDPDSTITFLSGGLDSRYLLADIVRARPGEARAVHAVTWAEKPDLPGSDTEVAALIAARLGIRHQFMARRSDEYETWFREVNYLLDSHSDVAADHPHEFQIMKSLREGGFRRVIRGDEAFGLRGMVYSPDASLANIDIRPFAGIPAYAEVMRPDWYRVTCAAGDEIYRKTRAAGEDMHPVDFKDQSYFALRVPTYLSSAAYYKQVLLDHRNPLLANPIMDFYRRVPLSLRLDKKLFFMAFARAHPELAAIPYSSVSGTEDWGVHMARDTPLRRLFLREMDDVQSGVWEVLDRERLVAAFNRITVASGTKKAAAWKRPLRGLRHVVAAVAPARVDSLALARAQGKLRASQLMFRALILKHWYDTFYAPRG